MAIDLPKLMEEINPFHTCEKKMITATSFRIVVELNELIHTRCLEHKTC